MTGNAPIVLGSSLLRFFGVYRRLHQRRIRERVLNIRCNKEDRYTDKGEKAESDELNYKCGS
jgi:hypothetical protein